MSETDREKKRLVSKLWYENNKPRREAYNRKKRVDRKQWAIDLLGGKCTDCGGVFPHCAFDFHHLSGDKDSNPSYALALSLERARQELDKCILLCANCHRIRHHVS